MKTEERKKILIVGATSALAHETAKHFAKARAALVLVARDKGKLQSVADDLQAQGASQVVSISMDMNEVHRHDEVLQQTVAVLGGLDIILIAHGTACSYQVCENQPEQLFVALQTNFVSTICLLNHIAKYLEKQRQGTLAVITSVAGDRGRRDQYIYAACKAGVSVFLQGLRQRLYSAGIAVVNLKPGLTHTPLTAHLPKGVLFSKAPVVAKGIYKAIKAKRAEVYLPWFWRWIMLIIRATPEALFKRLKFK